jgi:hypothetical protein
MFISFSRIPQQNAVAPFAPNRIGRLSFEDALKDVIESWRGKGLSIEWKFERSDNYDVLTEPFGGSGGTRM